MAVAGAGLVAVSPVLAASALVVRATSPGPVFFRQRRTGKGGVPFEVLKLRTMSAAHRHDPNEVIAANHFAVTPVGGVLRRLKLDEVPQLLNVLRGEMSLVGPRPTIPEQTDAYTAEQRRRLQVRPGLTGLAQVNGNAAISWDERIRYDLAYVDNLSLAMDLRILMRTVAVVLLGEERFISNRKRERT